MKKEMLIPSSVLLIYLQVISIFLFFSGFFILYFININYVVKTVLFIIISLHLLASIVALVLSFTSWWNVPIYMDSKGINRKNQRILWSEVESIKSFCIISNMPYPFSYGRHIDAFVRLTSHDGAVIYVVMNRLYEKLLFQMCEDKEFLEKYKRSAFIFDQNHFM